MPSHSATFAPPPNHLKVGVVLFPELTQLDLTGPYEVFTRLPDTRVFLTAETLAPVRSERGLVISPDVTFEQAPQLDIVCVPGGIPRRRSQADHPSAHRPVWFSMSSRVESACNQNDGPLPNA